jgi:hypothetical protein
MMLNQIALEGLQLSETQFYSRTFISQYSIEDIDEMVPLKHCQLSLV